MNAIKFSGLLFINLILEYLLTIITSLSSIRVSTIKIFNRSVFILSRALLKTLEEICFSSLMITILLTKLFILFEEKFSLSFMVKTIIVSLVLILIFQKSFSKYLKLSEFFFKLSLISILLVEKNL